MSANQSSLNFDNFFSGEPIQPVRPAEDYLRPLSRTTDARSSKRAEAEIKRTGVLRGQTKLALDLVKQYPGKTSRELASLGTLDRYVLAKRLPDLREMKLVHSSQNHGEDLRWWPKEAA